jgi:predicted negative regulator of RcsB-dependent stress response
MKSGTTRDTMIICVTVVIAIAILSIPAESYGNGDYLVWIVVLGVIGLGMTLGYRYLETRKRSQIELTGGEQYRQLVEEYRRLSDMALTTQEHTDLKLGDVSAQLDHLREQLASLQKILKDVE